MSSSRRTPLLIIFLTVFIDLLGFGIVLPLLPRYAKHFAADGKTLGLLMASFSAMQFLFAPLWGRVSDRIGRRPILILGLAGSSFFYSLFGWCTGLGAEGQLLGMGVLPWLFLCRIGAGIAGATIPTAQAYIADVTGPAERGKGMALIGAAFGIGFTFGPLLGAMFVPGDVTEARAPGYVAGVLSGLALLSAIFLLPESLPPGGTHQERHWLDVSQLRIAVAQPGIGMVLLTMFLTTFAFGQFESTLSLLTAHLGVADRNNYLVFAYIGFVLSLSQGLLVRRLIPKLGENVTGIIGTVLMTVGLLSIGFAATHESTGFLYGVLPIAVVGFSATNPSLQSLLSLRTSASDQGGVLGLGQSMSALARILAPLLGLTLNDMNITLPYWSAAGIMGLAVLLMCSLKQPPAAAPK